MVAGVGGADLVEALDGTGAVVEFVGVDFLGGEGGVEGDFDVGDEGDVLHFGRCGCCGAIQGGVMVLMLCFGGMFMFGESARILCLYADAGTGSI